MKDIIITIVVSEKDPAGMNIKDNLIKRSQFKITKEKYEGNLIYEHKDAETRLVTISEETIDHDDIDKKLSFLKENNNLDKIIIIYATKHSSRSGIPSLTAHTPGNWGNAEMGGQDRLLCKASEQFVKEAIIYMEKRHSEISELKNFDVVQEATHHGPYLESHVMFIEIGSLENEWKNQIAGDLIAETIMHLIENAKSIISKKNITAIGIGGTHTMSNFKKIILNENIAFSHVCPKYALENLNEENLKSALSQSTRPAEIIIFDWKGLGKEKDRIVSLVKESGIPYKRSKDF
ncbi:MAG: D-aminoacyl-tRNA deacylase [Candidatus Woesearchaeota archaeon]